MMRLSNSVEKLCFVPEGKTNEIRIRDRPSGFTADLGFVEQKSLFCPKNISKAADCQRGPF
jgi:hypothetical protein